MVVDCAVEVEMAEPHMVDPVWHLFESVDYPTTHSNVLFFGCQFVALLSTVWSQLIELLQGTTLGPAIIIAGIFSV